MTPPPPPRLPGYGLLIGLFPRRFRQDRERDINRLVLDMMAETQARGPLSRLGFLLRLYWDITSQAVRERLAPSRPRGQPRPPFRLGDHMLDVLSDVRYAVRSVLRQPLYGGFIILLMSLGIAGNAAVFRLFNGLFLRPLPFDRPEQLVDLDETAPRWNLEFVGIAYPDFVEWRRSNRTFDGLAVFSTTGRNFSGEGSAERIDIVTASYDLANVLGFQPILGRFFSDEEDRPDGAQVALLSQAFWRDRFGGSTDVLGRSVMLSGRTYEVIGVLPPAAEFVADAAAWIPLQEAETGESGWYLNGVGRLKVGVTMTQAREDLRAIHRGMIERRSVNETTSPVLNSLRDRYLGEYRIGSWALLGAVIIVLVIACANIAGLMLARSLARTREMGIRIALGASGPRIVRQLLTESLTLALVGAALGTIFAIWGSSALVAQLTDQFPRFVTFDLDWRFLGFTLAITVAASVFFGLAPALQAAAVDSTGVLHAASARASGSRGRRRAMNVLIAGEVALAMALLVVAGLSVSDIRRLQRLDPGYRTDSILTFRIDLPSARYETAAQRLGFAESHLERLHTLPGVASATVASTLPLSGHWGWFFEAEGAPPRAPDEPNPVVLNRIVSPEYFATMGVVIKAGRGLDARDGRDSTTRVVVVNETFARLFFGDGVDPIGKRIRTGDQSPWMTVVGVAGDVKHYGVDNDMRPGVYQPFRQFPLSRFMVAVRANTDPGALTATIRGVLQEADPDLPLFNVMTMQERFDRSLWARRASSLLIGAFSTVALLLAVAGIYGVISYGVGQRTREISIRLALGARRSQVVRQVMRHGMTLIAVGLVIGLAGAYGAARFVAGMLAGVSPNDYGTYTVVTALLLIVAAAANLIPARRASRLEPMKALREE